MFLRFSITSILAMFTLNAQSQSLPVVFGNTSNMFVVDLGDIELPPPPQQGSSNVYDQFDLDMDNDGIFDLRFNLNRTYSPSGGMSNGYVHVTGNDSTYVLVNENYNVILSSTYPVVETHQDSFTVVIKGDFSDTLDTSGYFIQNEQIMNEYNGDWINPCGTGCYHDHYDINEWNADNVYISVKKIINNFAYYGWVKISANVLPVVTLHEYAFNTTLIGLEAENSEAVLLYPNPTTHTIMVKGSFDSRIELQNAWGQVVKTWEINPFGSNQSLDVSEISNGLYWVILSANGKQVVKKLIKQ